MQRIRGTDTLTGMQPVSSPVLTGSVAFDDGAIVRRIVGGERSLFEVLMRRHNQQVYRAVRSVLRDEADVEDVMQQTYVSAFTHLHQFEQRAQFSTWLIRIALNEAFARRRLVQRSADRANDTVANEPHEDSMDTVPTPHAGPEQLAYASELGRLLETALDALPEHYRTVFMLRQVEGLSTAETAASLELGDEAVKTRLHRARSIVRKTIAARIGEVATGAFQFHAMRCDRVVSAVLLRISHA